MSFWLILLAIIPLVPTIKELRILIKITFYSKKYIGVIIESEKENVLLSVYDKKKDLSCSVVNYSRVDSNIPEAMVYSAYLGQLFRFWNICTENRLSLLRLQA